MARVLQDPMWGPLTVDDEALAEKMGTATAACMEASRAAQYQSESGMVINSPEADILGALSTVIDGLLDQLEARKDV